ncbi:probable inactive receptor kinase At2g26730 [Phragmites australis]|uniref:probable inactive receptor kinase At2g26730 n=1 Tax=Phragmites australis TaxID=29695 RepID=UPI002D795199|nr:probable inactive receptor kinase At2g26730 [Phragmites australis]
MAVSSRPSTSNRFTHASSGQHNTTKGATARKPNPRSRATETPARPMQRTMLLLALASAAACTDEQPSGGRAAHDAVTGAPTHSATQAQPLQYRAHKTHTHAPHSHLFLPKFPTPDNKQPQQKPPPAQKKKANASEESFGYSSSSPPLSSFAFLTNASPVAASPAPTPVAMAGPRAHVAAAEAAALAALFAIASLACCAVAEPPPSERSALLAFLTATPHERRLGWNTSTPACGWVGVTCDAANSTVVEVRLPGIGIIGAIPPGTLGRLTNLRVLSLRSNRLLGSIPDDVLQLPSLKALFLQQNLLSGAIPPVVARLGGLERLVLSHNNLSGSIPFALNNLTALRVLRLDGNKLSGSIPSISIPGLNVFNVSDNNLNGSIPKSLSRFPRDSFAGNLQLCGEPLPPCTSPFFPPSPAPGLSPGGGPEPGSSKKRKLSGAAIAGIIVGAVVAALLLLIVIVLCARSHRRGAAREGPKGATSAAAPARGLGPTASGEGGGMTSSSKEDLGGGASGSAAAAAAAAAGAGAGEQSRLVFVGKGAGYSFDLEDLLRASAEVLGKGSVGTSYKAVLEEGTTVVVKRLKDVAVARREFDAHMEALGKMEHRNVLPVRAYYYSKDEKLLVYDYLPNGSLSAMLHGSRGSGRTPLDWEARMRSALSAARGLAHLHTAHNLVHGNVKASNVLLRPDADAAALSDFCLHPLFDPSSTRASGYRAPEVVDTRRLTFKADVYSLGVLLLELLTGKSPSYASLEGDGTLDLPRWVQSVVREEWTAEVFDVELVRLGASAEEEMVALLQVAMACVATVPDARPDAPDVVRMIEEIGGGHGQTTTEESEQGVRGTSEEERSRGTPPAAPTP